MAVSAINLPHLPEGRSAQDQNSYPFCGRGRGGASIRHDVMDAHDSAGAPRISMYVCMYVMYIVALYIYCSTYTSRAVLMSAQQEGPPSAKKSRMDDGGDANGASSYIPTEKDGGPQFSVVFSMKEEKGALVRALELCKVS